MQLLETECGFATETGKRQQNEDFVAFYLGNKQERTIYGSVAVIADGIGGTKGGRYAAELAVVEFIDAYYSQKETLGVKKMAEKSLTSINHWIFSQSRRDASLKGMGTTFSAVILLGSQVHLVHLGDTRIYRLRQNRLQLLTTDHIHQHPDLAHVLTRALGIDGAVNVDYSQHNLNLHDRFLLCCDGVHTALSASAIGQSLSQNRSPQEIATTLVAAALQHSQDNVSAMVVDILQLPPADKSFLEAAVDELPLLPVPKISDVVDGFCLQQKISSSRYTCLFLAQDQTHEHGEVVMKFPKPQANCAKIYRQAFVRENWITSHVHNIWLCEQIELVAGRQTCLYTIMPYYEGETLESMLLRESVSLETGVAIAKMLAKAVYALHKEQIIHRDIKPDNVILLQDGGLKLIDLGVARLPGLNDEMESTAPGTPSYMSQALFKGGRGDEQSDLYALSVTLYRLFSRGHYPYGEVEPFTRPNFTKATPLSQYRPDLPSWLGMLLLREVHPDKVFVNAMDLVYELENGMARGSTILPMPQPLPSRLWGKINTWFN